MQLPFKQEHPTIRLTRARHPLPLRIGSALLCLVFAVQDSGLSAVDLKADSRVAVERLRVPQNLGIVKESAAADPRLTIINIKDVHDNWGAQESIASILETLVANYDIRTIGIEGHEGPLDVSVLSALPDAKMKESTARFMLREGTLSAGEFFAALNSGNAAVYGMDDARLYEDNLSAFYRMQSMRDAHLAKADELLRALMRAEEAVCSEELVMLNRNGILSRNGTVKFSRRWKIVASVAERHGVNYRDKTNISQLLSAMQKESRLDFKKANAQRESLLEELGASLSRDKAERLIEQSVAYKLGKVSAAGYSSYLLELAGSEGRDLSAYADLSDYAQYMILYESIDLEGLKEEIADLEERLRGKLIRNSSERQLVDAVQRAETLKDLYDAKLSSASLERFRTERDLYSAEAFADQLRRHGVTGPSETDLQELFEALPEAERFYEAAEKRNQALLDNTVRRMREKGQTVACLVTGGFHSKGIVELLRHRQASYVVILPRYNKDSARPYLTVIANTRGPLSGLAAQDEAARAKIRMIVHYFAQVAFDAADKAGDSAALKQAAVHKSVEHAKARYLEAYRSLHRRRAPPASASDSAPVSASAAVSASGTLNSSPHSPVQLSQADTEESYYLAPRSLITGAAPPVEVDGLSVNYNTSSDSEKVTVTVKNKSFEVTRGAGGQLTLTPASGTTSQNTASEQTASPQKTRTFSDKVLDLMVQNPQAALQRLRSLASSQSDKQEIRDGIQVWIIVGEAALMSRQAGRPMTEQSIAAMQKTLHRFVRSVRGAGFRDELQYVGIGSFNVVFRFQGKNSVTVYKYAYFANPQGEIRKGYGDDRTDVQLANWLTPEDLAALSGAVEGMPLIEQQSGTTVFAELKDCADRQDWEGVRDVLRAYFQCQARLMRDKGVFMLDAKMDNFIVIKEEGGLRAVAIDLGQTLELDHTGRAVLYKDGARQNGWGEELDIAQLMYFIDFFVAQLKAASDDANFQEFLEQEFEAAFGPSSGAFSPSLMRAFNEESFRENPAKFVDAVRAKDKESAIKILAEMFPDKEAEKQFRSGLFGIPSIGERTIQLVSELQEAARSGADSNKIVELLHNVLGVLRSGQKDVTFGWSHEDCQSVLEAVIQFVNQIGRMGSYESETTLFTALTVLQRHLWLALHNATGMNKKEAVLYTLDMRRAMQERSARLLGRLNSKDPEERRQAQEFLKDLLLSQADREKRLSSLGIVVDGGNNDEGPILLEEIDAAVAEARWDSDTGVVVVKSIRVRELLIRLSFGAMRNSTAGFAYLLGPASLGISLMFALRGSYGRDNRKICFHERAHGELTQATAKEDTTIEEQLLDEVNAYFQGVVRTRWQVDEKDWSRMCSTLARYPQSYYDVEDDKEIKRLQSLIKVAFDVVRAMHESGYTSDQIQTILIHYAKLGQGIDKLVEDFGQATPEQLRAQSDTILKGDAELERKVEAKKMQAQQKLTEQIVEADRLSQDILALSAESMEELEKVVMTILNTIVALQKSRSITNNQAKELRESLRSRYGQIRQELRAREARTATSASTSTATTTQAIAPTATTQATTQVSTVQAPAPAQTAPTTAQTATTATTTPAAPTTTPAAPTTTPAVQAATTTTATATSASTSTATTTKAIAPTATTQATTQVSTVQAPAPAQQTPSVASTALEDEALRSVEATTRAIESASTRIRAVLTAEARDENEHDLRLLEEVLVHVRQILDGSKPFNAVEFITKLKSLKNLKTLGSDKGWNPATLFRLAVLGISQPQSSTWDELQAFFEKTTPEDRQAILKRINEKLVADLMDVQTAYINFKRAHDTSEWKLKDKIGHSAFEDINKEIRNYRGQAGSHSEDQRVALLHAMLREYSGKPSFVGLLQSLGLIEEAPIGERQNFWNERAKLELLIQRFADLSVEVSSLENAESSDLDKRHAILKEGTDQRLQLINVLLNQSYHDVETANTSLKVELEREKTATGPNNKTIQKRLGKLFETQMSLPAVDPADSAGLSKRLQETLEMMDLLLEVATGGGKRLRTNQKLMLLSLLSGHHAGVGTAGGKTIAGYLFHLSARMLYGDLYRGNLLAEDPTGANNYLAKVSEIKDMAAISGFKLFKITPREKDHAQHIQDLKEFLGHSDGVTVMTYHERAFAYLDALVAAIQGDHSLFQALRVSFVSLDEFHLFLTSRDSCQISDGFQQGLLNMTQEALSIIQKFYDPSNPIAYNNFHSKYEVVEASYSDDLQNVFKRLDKDPGAKLILYDPIDKRVRLTPALREEILNGEGGLGEDEEGMVEALLRGVLAERGRDYDLNKDAATGEEHVVPSSVNGGIQASSLFGDVWYTTGIALKESGMDVQKATAKVRRSNTSVQSAFIGSIQIPGAVIVGYSGTLEGLGPMSRAQTNRKVDNISTSSADPLRVGGMGPGHVEHTVRGIPKGEILYQLFDFLNRVKSGESQVRAVAASATDEEGLAFIEAWAKANDFEVVLLNTAMSIEEVAAIAEDPTQNRQGKKRLLIMTENTWIGRDFKSYAEAFGQRIGIDLHVYGAESIPGMDLTQLIGRVGRDGAEGQTVRSYYVRLDRLLEILSDLSEPQVLESFIDKLARRLAQNPEEIGPILQKLRRFRSEPALLKELRAVMMNADKIKDLFARHGLAGIESTAQSRLHVAAAKQGKLLSQLTPPELVAALKTVGVQATEEHAGSFLPDLTKALEESAQKTSEILWTIGQLTDSAARRALDTAGLNDQVNISSLVRSINGLHQQTVRFVLNLHPGVSAGDKQIQDLIKRVGDKLVTAEDLRSALGIGDEALASKIAGQMNSRRTVDRLSDEVLEECLKQAGVNVEDDKEKARAWRDAVRGMTFSVEGLMRVSNSYLDFKIRITQGALFKIHDQARTMPTTRLLSLLEGHPVKGFWGFVHRINPFHKKIGRARTELAYREAMDQGPSNASTRFNPRMQYQDPYQTVCSDAQMTLRQYLNHLEGILGFKIEESERQTWLKGDGGSPGELGARENKRKARLNILKQLGLYVLDYPYMRMIYLEALKTQLEIDAMSLARVEEIRISQQLAQLGSASNHTAGSIRLSAKRSGLGDLDDAWAAHSAQQLNTKTVSEQNALTEKELLELLAPPAGATARTRLRRGWRLHRPRPFSTRWQTAFLSDLKRQLTEGSFFDISGRAPIEDTIDHFIKTAVNLVTEDVIRVQGESGGVLGTVHNLQGHVETTAGRTQSMTVEKTDVSPNRIDMVCAGVAPGTWEQGSQLKVSWDGEKLRIGSGDLSGQDLTAAVTVTADADLKSMLDHMADGRYWKAHPSRRSDGKWHVVMTAVQDVNPNATLRAFLQELGVPAGPVSTFLEILMESQTPADLEKVTAALGRMTLEDIAARLGTAAGIPIDGPALISVLNDIDDSANYNSGDGNLTLSQVARTLKRDVRELALEVATRCGCSLRDLTGDTSLSDRLSLDDNLTLNQLAELMSARCGRLFSAVTVMQFIEREIVYLRKVFNLDERDLSAVHIKPHQRHILRWVRSNPSALRLFVGSQSGSAEWELIERMIALRLCAGQTGTDDIRSTLQGIVSEPVIQWRLGKTGPDAEQALQQALQHAVALQRQINQERAEKKERDQKLVEKDMDAKQRADKKKRDQDSALRWEAGELYLKSLLTGDTGPVADETPLLSKAAEAFRQELSTDEAEPSALRRLVKRLKRRLGRDRDAHSGRQSLARAERILRRLNSAPRAIPPRPNPPIGVQIILTVGQALDQEPLPVSDWSWSQLDQFVTAQVKEVKKKHPALDSSIEDNDLIQTVRALVLRRLRLDPLHRMGWEDLDSAHRKISNLNGDDNDPILQLFHKSVRLGLLSALTVASRHMSPRWPVSQAIVEKRAYQIHEESNTGDPDRNYFKAQAELNQRGQDADGLWRAFVDYGIMSQQSTEQIPESVRLVWLLALAGFPPDLEELGRQFKDKSDDTQEQRNLNQLFRNRTLLQKYGDRIQDRLKLLRQYDASKGRAYPLSRLPQLAFGQADPEDLGLGRLSGLAYDPDEAVLSLAESLAGESPGTAKYDDALKGVLSRVEWTAGPSGADPARTQRVYQLLASKQNPDSIEGLERKIGYLARARESARRDEAAFAALHQELLQARIRLGDLLNASPESRLRAISVWREASEECKEESVLAEIKLKIRSAAAESAIERDAQARAVEGVLSQLRQADADSQEYIKGRLHSLRIQIELFRRLAEEEPTRAMIDLRAYQLWEERGHRHDNAEQNWLDAEKELKSKLQHPGSSAIPPVDLVESVRELESGVYAALSKHWTAAALELLTPVLVILSETGQTALADPAVSSDPAASAGPAASDDPATSRHPEPSGVARIALLFGKILHQNAGPLHAPVAGYTTQEQDRILNELYRSLFQKAGQAHAETEVRHYRFVVEHTGGKDDELKLTEGLREVRRAGLASVLPDKQAQDQAAKAGIVPIPLLLRNNSDQFKRDRDMILGVLKTKRSELELRVGRRHKSFAKQLLKDETLDKMSYGLAANIDAGSKTLQEVRQVIDDEMDWLAQLIPMRTKDPGGPLNAQLVIAREIVGQWYGRVSGTLLNENDRPAYVEPPVLWIPRKKMATTKSAGKPERSFAAAYLEGAGVVILPLEDLRTDAENLTLEVLVHEHLHAVSADFGHHDLREGLISRRAQELAAQWTKKQSPSSEGEVSEVHLTSSDMTLKGYQRAHKMVDRLLGPDFNNLSRDDLDQALLTGSMSPLKVYGIREAIAALEARRVQPGDVVRIAGRRITMQMLKKRFGNLESDDPSVKPVYARIVQDGDGDWGLQLLDTNLKETSPKLLDRMVRDHDPIYRQRVKVFISKVLPGYVDLYRKGRALPSQLKEVLETASDIDRDFGEAIKRLLEATDRPVSSEAGGELTDAVIRLNDDLLLPLGFEINSEFEYKTGLPFVHAGEIAGEYRHKLSLRTGGYKEVSALDAMDLDIVKNRSRESALNRPGESSVHIFGSSSLEWTANNILPYTNGEYLDLLKAISEDLVLQRKGLSSRWVKLDEMGRLIFIESSSALRQFPHGLSLLSTINHNAWQHPIQAGPVRLSGPRFLGHNPEAYRAVLDRYAWVVEAAAEKARAHLDIILKPRSVVERIRSSAAALYRDYVLPTLIVHEFTHKKDDIGKWSRVFKDGVERETDSHLESSLNTDGFKHYGKGVETMAIKQMLGYLEEDNQGLEYKQVAADSLAYMTHPADRLAVKVGSLLQIGDRNLSAVILQGLGAALGVLIGSAVAWGAAALLSLPVSWPVVAAVGVLSLAGGWVGWRMLRGEYRLLMDGDIGALRRLRRRLAAMPIETSKQRARQRLDLFEAMIERRIRSRQEPPETTPPDKTPEPTPSPSPTAPAPPPAPPPPASHPVGARLTGTVVAGLGSDDDKEPRRSSSQAILVGLGSDAADGGTTDELIRQLKEKYAWAQFVVVSSDPDLAKIQLEKIAGPIGRSSYAGIAFVALPDAAAALEGALERIRGLLFEAARAEYERFAALPSDVSSEVFRPLLRQVIRTVLMDSSLAPVDWDQLLRETGVESVRTDPADLLSSVVMALGDDKIREGSAPAPGDYTRLLPERMVSALGDRAGDLDRTLAQEHDDVAAKAQELMLALDPESLTAKAIPIERLFLPGNRLDPGMVRLLGLHSPLGRRLQNNLVVYAIRGKEGTEDQQSLRRSQLEKAGLSWVADSMIVLDPSRAPIEQFRGGNDRGITVLLDETDFALFEASIQSDTKHRYVVLPETGPDRAAAQVTPIQALTLAIAADTFAARLIGIGSLDLYGNTQEGRLKELLSNRVLAIFVSMPMRVSQILSEALRSIRAAGVSA